MAEGGEKKSAVARALNDNKKPLYPPFVGPDDLSNLGEHSQYSKTDRMFLSVGERGSPDTAYGHSDLTYALLDYWGRGDGNNPSGHALGFWERKTAC